MDSTYLAKRKKAEYDKIYRKKNKEKIAKYFHKYYRTHKQEKKKYDEKYREKNREHIRVLARKNYLKNIKQRRARMRKYRNKLHNKIVNNLRSRVRLALRGSYKDLSTLELLGCSLTHFKKHLKKQFKQEMNWDNYGRYGWHIDHIIPCYKFDLTKKSEQLKCFHYTNLQPLWENENCAKNGGRGGK